ncbi:hypothetical protein LTR37_000680 [Vermiconidia calcicola]|uniref:Uncharacterized protein n=1 Tax=Vermiconidia calcicola TaxID=1690605 RepID=A0ACC3NZR4_9PEZI|nr:hypothetical protein LTR37_000680 [Vermiconidia calcicola]
MPSWARDSVMSLESATVTVAELAREHRSLAEIITALMNHDMISTDVLDGGHNAALAVAFALLGWLSMLYEPEIMRVSSDQIAISDVLDGYRSSAYFKLTQRSPDRRRKLPELLLSFGLMLRKEDVFTSEDGEDAGAIEQIAVVTPGGLNASTLTSLACLKVQWVDVIAPHLELDQATNTLFLYRYPSFCLANLPPENDGDARGMIHR